MNLTDRMSTGLTHSFLALLLMGCTGSGLGDQPIDADGSRLDTRRANWVDADTNGVGTHRVTSAALNVRDATLTQVRHVAAADDLLVTTRATSVRNGVTFYEAVFKGGALDGAYGWVAGDHLAHAQLQVCAEGVAIRSLDQLGVVVDTASRGEAAFVASSTIRNTGNHRYFDVVIHGVRGYVATDFLCRAGSIADTSRAGLAQTLLGHHDHGDAELWSQNFGRLDGASPLDNVLDAAAGLASRRSCHGGAPCGTVLLDPALLGALNALVEERGFRFFVTSIAGAAHSPGSLHYAGRAVDVDEVNGVRIYGNSPQATAFMNACWSLGAVEVFGPSNDPVGHFDHIHCAW